VLLAVAALLAVATLLAGIRGDGMTPVLQARPVAVGAPPGRSRPRPRTSATTRR